MQPRHALAVYLHHVKVRVRPVYQVLGEDAHARPYLQHTDGLGRQAVDDAARDALIGEEMLSQELLGSYFIHLAFNAL